jgi:hypothetical protein
MFRSPKHQSAWFSFGGIKTSTWVLAGLVLIAAIARLHTYQEPLENDLARYAVYGHEMNQGRLLYSDLWDFHPPAIYETYALAERLVGYGQQEAYFLGLLAFFLTLWGVYQAGSAGGMGEKAGLWAALFWTAISSDMLLQANQPNAEVFMNACLVWILLIFIDDEESHRHRFWAAGVLLAVGTMYKQQLILPVLFGLGVTIWRRAKEKGPRTSFQLILPVVIPVLVAWMALLSYLALTGRLGIYWDTTMGFGGYYSGNILGNLLNGFRFSNLFPSFILPFTPLFLLIIAGSAGFFKEYRAQWFLFFSFWVGSVLAVVCTGKYFPHYYQLWLPFLAIGGGWAAEMIADRVKPFSAPLRWAPALLCLGWLLIHEIPTYFLDADQWSAQKYGYSFSDCRWLGKIVGETLKPDETFLLWGDTPSIYFYSQKSPPTGVIILAALSGPMAQPLTDRLFKDLAEKKPEMLIVDDFQYHDYYRHFLTKYGKWKYYPANGHFILMVKKGGALEKRLGLKPAVQGF